MLTKNGGILLQAPPSGARAQALRVPFGLHRSLNQVLFIAPLFWFMELVQNKIYLLCSQGYGWFYRDAQGRLADWYSFRSLLPWAFTVLVFSLLDALLFEQRRTPLLLRMVIAGVIGWCGELGIGAFFDRVLGQCLQVWPGSRLIYIAPSALPFWILDYGVFHWLTRELRMAHDYRLTQR